jgi:hypothetical protein
MFYESFTPQHRTIGRATAWAEFGLGVVYAVILVLGLLSLKSPQDPIGDPFFTLMEILIILTTPLMLVSMVAVHAYAAPEDKVYSLTALIFMTLLTGITSSVHFILLTVGRQIAASGNPLAPLLLSWQWPSVVYTVDILAWDWFFALAMLFAAPVFKVGRLEKTVRLLMLVSGGVSLAGLIGVPLANMQVRNIGIIGYGAVAPVVFLLLGILFGRAQLLPDDTTPMPVAQTGANSQRLALIRTVHTVIYLVMAAATFVLVYAGVSGAQGVWLWLALVLLGVEVVVFVGNGMRCPLTALAVRYGAETGYVFDTFLPERATRYTFNFFGTLMAVGVVLLFLRWVGLLG